MSRIPLRVLRVIVLFLVLIALALFGFQNAAVLSARLQLSYNLGIVKTPPMNVPVYTLLLVVFLLGVVLDGLLGLVYWYKASLLEERLKRASHVKGPVSLTESAEGSYPKKKEDPGETPWDELA